VVFTNYETATHICRTNNAIKTSYGKHYMDYVYQADVLALCFL